MEYIRVTKENIEKEHICCAISNNNDVQVASKKAWLSERFDDGLVFLKSTERGKCFIEYIPAENAWNPIEADGYMFIDCLWVSGSFKGHGYSNDLLGECIADSKSKGKKGLCILSSAKKKPFLADPKYLKYKGFEICDEADNGIQLWYLPFEKKLIGVVSVSVQSLMATKKFTSYISCDELHQDVWKKKFNYQKYHGGNGPYVGDYKNIPRGRIFYNSKTNEFDIMVGSWIKEGDNIFCIDLVKNEFNLNDQKCNVKVGIHWEIGMGWENR